MAITKVKVKNQSITYDIWDERIPQAPEDGEYYLITGEDGKAVWQKCGEPTPEQVYKITQEDRIAFVEGSIPIFNFVEPLSRIRDKTFFDMPALLEVNISEVLGNVGSYAFANNENLETIKIGKLGSIGDSAFAENSNLKNIELGKVKGSIGYNAFYDNTKVEHFIISSDSEIDEIKAGAFYNLGCDREEGQRFIFDFFNSNFTLFTGFGPMTGTSGSGSGSGSGEEPVPVKPTLINASIILPPTVDEISCRAVGINYMSGADGLFGDAENVDIYFTGKTVPSIANDKALPNDELSHILVPYKYYELYKYTTNWVGMTNLYGYDIFEVGVPLPLFLNNGYEVTWYDDLSLTHEITVGNGYEVYCVAHENKIGSVISLKQYQGAMLVNGEEILDRITVLNGTEVTITPKFVYEDRDVLKVFTVAGQDYLNEGSATIVLENDVQVCVSYGTLLSPTLNPILKENNIEDVAMIMDEIGCPGCWAPGDELKEISLTNNSKLIMELADTTEYLDIANSGYKANNIFVAKYVLPNSRGLYQSSPGSNMGGWANTDVRSYLNNDFINMLPNEVQPLLAAVSVPYMNGGNQPGVELRYSEDKVWLLSVKEIFGRYTGGMFESMVEQEVEKQLQMFEDLGVKQGNAGKARKYASAASSSSSFYWTRNTSPNTSNYWTYIGYNGSPNATVSVSYYYIVPCFSLTKNKFFEKVNVRVFQGEAKALRDGQPYDFSKGVHRGIELTFYPQPEEGIEAELKLFEVDGIDYTEQGQATITVSNNVNIRVQYYDTVEAEVELENAKLNITGLEELSGSDFDADELPLTGMVNIKPEGINGFKYGDTWVSKSWSGLTSFNGYDIWTDGENIYYSVGSNQYILDKSTSTWSRKTWNGLTSFWGNYVWSDSENIYYSSPDNPHEHYVLDKVTSTWSQKTWNGFNNFSASSIWTDGENIYCSVYDAGPDISYQYVLDKSTSTWSEKTWNNQPPYFDGYHIWTDGENIYTSYYDLQYVLDKSTSTWNPKTWNGLTSFVGECIWTDGENIYYSGSSTKQYILDKSTSTWNPKTWNGLSNPDGRYPWTDGENIYYSKSSEQYQLPIKQPTIFRINDVDFTEQGEANIQVEEGMEIVAQYYNSPELQIKALNSTLEITKDGKPVTDPLRIGESYTFTPEQVVDKREIYPLVLFKINDVDYTEVGTATVVTTENMEIIVAYTDKQIPSTSFANATYEEIAQAFDDDIAWLVYNTGDEKEITLNDGSKLTMCIYNGAEQDSPELYDNSYKEGIKHKCLLVSKYCLEENRQMNSNSTNEGGWGASELRNYLNTSFVELLPSALVKYIVDVKVPYMTGGNQSGVKLAYSDDKIFLMNAKEIYNGSTYNGNTIESKANMEAEHQLDFYRKLNTTTDNYTSARKAKLRFPNDYVAYRCRGCYQSTNYGFIYVMTSGSIIYVSYDSKVYANEYLGIVPCFSLSKHIFVRPNVKGINGKVEVTKDGQIITDGLQNNVVYTFTAVPETGISSQLRKFEINGIDYTNTGTADVLVNDVINIVVEYYDISTVTTDLDNATLDIKGSSGYFNGKEFNISNLPVNSIVDITPNMISGNKFNDTWSIKKWTGHISDAIYVWTDGDNIYYSDSSTQYILDKSTSTWTEKTWNGLTNFYGYDVWTDGDNIYYSEASKQYILDKSTSTWNVKTWNGLTNFYGQRIWTDGDNIYYSSNSNEYVLDKSTSTWNTKTWNNLPSDFYGHHIWTDGENIYYSESSSHYVLDKSTSTWSQKTWTGLNVFVAQHIWTDGENIYYSEASKQYILDKSTSTWTEKTWNDVVDISSFYGSRIWTDKDNIYYSFAGRNYILDYRKPTVFKVNNQDYSNEYKATVIVGNTLDIVLKY